MSTQQEEKARYRLFTLLRNLLRYRPADRHKILMEAFLSPQEVEELRKAFNAIPYYTYSHNQQQPFDYAEAESDKYTLFHLLRRFIAECTPAARLHILREGGFTSEEIIALQKLMNGVSYHTRRSLSKRARQAEPISLPI